MIALLLLAFGAEPAKPIDAPAVCVALRSRANVDLDELLAAMRARISRRAVRVIACDRAQPKEITWRLDAAIEGDDVTIALKGKDLDATRTVSVRGMSATEIVQTISLTAVEAVRPSIDKLLIEMGLLAQPEPDLTKEIERQAPVCPEPQPCVEKPAIVRTVEVFRPPAWMYGLALGPMFGVDVDGTTPAVSGYAEVVPSIWFGSFGLALHLGANLVPEQSANDVSVQVTELELGARVLGRAGPVELGLGAQNRLSIARVTSSSPFLEDGTQFFWNGGFQLLAGAPVWSNDAFALAVEAHVWLWPQPNRFLFLGEPLVRQGHAEVFVGPVIRRTVF